MRSILGRSATRGGRAAWGLALAAVCVAMAACGQVTISAADASAAIAAVKNAVKTGTVVRTPTAGNMPLETGRFPDAPGATSGTIPLGGPPPVHGVRTIVVSFAVSVAPQVDGNDVVTFVEGWPSGTDPCAYACPTSHTWIYAVAPAGAVVETTQSGSLLPNLAP